MDYSEIARFLDVAEQSHSYPEFMMEIVFRKKNDVGTREFYFKHMMPVLFPCSSNCKDDENLPFVDYVAVRTGFREKLMALRWIQDYILAMDPNAKSLNLS